MQNVRFSEPCSARLRILITGSSGFIGKPLTAFLRSSGHELEILHHSQQEIPLKQLENLDVVINLAGENISTKRWSKQRRCTLFRSRCRGTWFLASLCSRLQSPPKTWINASAVGIYGNREEETLTEDSPIGHGFLANLCVHWEQATSVLINTRVVYARFGMILDPSGGLLSKILPLFRLCLGGRIGSGMQYMSWISLEDVIGGIHHILTHPDITGPVNFTAPHPVTQTMFASLLAQKLHRPVGPPLPAWIARLFFGQMADELLLASTKALPKKLLDTGYTFKHPLLEEFFKTTLQ